MLFRSYRDRRRVRQQVDAVVAGPCRWEALWLVEDVAVLLQEVVQERVRLVEGGCHKLQLGGHRPRPTDARPLDATAPLPPEDEGQGVEVP